MLHLQVMRHAILVVLMLTLGVNAMCAGAAGEREARIAKLRALLEKNPSEPRLLLKLATQYVHLADETERQETADQARQLLTQAEKAGAGPETRAWMGLLRCIEAKYGSGVTARTLAQDGLHMLDEAVEADAANLKFRVMRASVSLRVPREWKRLEQAKDDLLVAELAIRRDPRRIHQYDIDAAELYFKLGQAHLGTGELTEARAAWQLAVKQVPATKYAREAERFLKRHGG